MNECKGLFGWMFGHHFEAHYNMSAPTLTSLKNVYDGDEAARMIDASKSRTLASVVCRRCGATSP